MITNAHEIVSSYVDFAKAKWDRKAKIKLERQIELSLTPDGIVTGNSELYELSTAFDTIDGSYTATIEVKKSTGGGDPWFVRTASSTDWNEFVEELSKYETEFSAIWLTLVRQWRSEQNQL